MSTSRLLMRYTAIVLLAATAGGCSAPSGPPASVRQPAMSRQPDIRLDRDAVDLVTGSGRQPDRQYVITRAEEAVTRRCMRAHGLHWSGYVGRPVGRSEEERAIRMADRRRYGYGLHAAARPDAEPSKDADPRTERALFGSADQVADLTVAGIGTITYPLHGCLAEGHAAVYGDIHTWARVAYLPQGFMRTLNKVAATDQRYLAVLEKWRECMSRRGLTYADPDAVRVGLGRRYRANDIPMSERKRVEIGLAVTDAECNMATGLARIHLTVRRDAAQALDRGQRSIITDLVAAEKSAASRAGRLSLG